MDPNRAVAAAVCGFITHNSRALIVAAIGAAAFLGTIVAFAAPHSLNGFDTEIANHAQAMIEEGRKTFRFDTFGSEAFWGGALQLHKAIAGERNGGVGPGVSPKTALSVGLKVDADALPDTLKKQLAAGAVNLDDPAATIALLTQWSALRPSPMPMAASCAESQALYRSPRRRCRYRQESSRHLGAWAF